MAVSTFSIGNGGLPLLPLEGVLELFSYGSYKAGQLRHNKSEVRAEIHAALFDRLSFHKAISLLQTSPRACL